MLYELRDRRMRKADKKMAIWLGEKTWASHQKKKKYTFGEVYSSFLGYWFSYKLKTRSKNKMMKKKYWTHAHPSKAAKK